MSGYVAIDPACRVVIHDTDRERVLLCRDDAGCTVRAPLTPDMLHRLAYDAALAYRELTGEGLIPREPDPIKITDPTPVGDDFLEC